MTRRPDYEAIHAQAVDCIEELIDIGHSQLEALDRHSRKLRDMMGKVADLVADIGNSQMDAVEGMHKRIRTVLAHVRELKDQLEG